jgi:hypothetical protein
MKILIFVYTSRDITYFTSESHQSLIEMNEVLLLYNINFSNMYQ